MNEIEMAWTRYEVATIDRGYHVYATVLEAAIGQILPCEQEGGNIYNPYTVAFAENNHTPIDSDTLAFTENFRSKNFRDLPRNREIRESFYQRKIPAIRYTYMHYISTSKDTREKKFL